MTIPYLIKKIIRLTHLISAKLFIFLVILLTLSFGTAIYTNCRLYTSHFQKIIVGNAVKISNIIKRATYHSMLTNRREDLTNDIINIVQEEGIEGIRIYNKKGRVSFSDNLTELDHVVDKKAEQCYVCHAEEPAMGILATNKERIRIWESPQGYRLLGLINPIENEPECSNADCHAHSPDIKLLGLLDVKLSLEKVDQGIAETRKRMVINSIIFALMTALLKGASIFKMIHQPIKKLLRGTEEVASLNLNYKVNINSRDELGVLADSFNNMTGELKSSSVKLRKTQASLILSEKMASLGKLSAMVAHEINNPLSGILSYAKLSLKYLRKGKVNAEVLEVVSENLRIIGNEAKMCGEIVKNLLLFSKKTPELFKSESLNRIINTSINVIKHSAEMNNLELAKKLDQGDDSIQCEPGVLQQVLIALIVNAIEALSQNGKITISTDYHTYKNRVQVIIEDNGKGIPKDILPHIFEPFFSTKESEKSTGLGLSVVYGIIKQHGGTIEVSSKENEGAKFTITLPRTQGVDQKNNKRGEQG